MVQVSPVDGQIWLVFMSLTSYLYESCALEIIQWIFELLHFFFLFSRQNIIRISVLCILAVSRLVFFFFLSL